MCTLMQAIDRGSAVEEPTLKLLRRLLLIVTGIVIVFGILFTVLSQALISNGVNEARVLVLGARRIND